MVLAAMTPPGNIVLEVLNPKQWHPVDITRSREHPNNIILDEGGEVNVLMFFCAILNVTCEK